MFKKISKAIRSKLYFGFGGREKLINDLPDDVILNILEFLDVQTLNQLCLTNKRFYEVITCYPQIYSKFILHVNYKDARKLPDSRSTLLEYLMLSLKLNDETAITKTGVRKFNKIIVKEMTNDHYQHFADLTENFNEEIHEIEAINMKLDEEVARKLFEFLPNLRKLSINSEFFEPVYDSNLLTNSLLKCTELRQLTMQGTQYSNAFRQIDFKSSKLKVLKVDWRCCKMSDLLDSNRDLNLKYSSISDLIINSNFQQTDNAVLKLILEIPHLKSLKVKLFQKKEIDEEIFKKTYPNIEKLDLTDAYIDDDSECGPEDLESSRLKKWSIVKIYEFLRLFPNLKTLDLNLHISARYDPSEVMKTFHPPTDFSFNLDHLLKLNEVNIHECRPQLLRILQIKQKLSIDYDIGSEYYRDHAASVEDWEKFLERNPNCHKIQYGRRSYSSSSIIEIIKKRCSLTGRYNNEIEAVGVTKKNRFHDKWLVNGFDLSPYEIKLHFMEMGILRLH